MSSSWAELMTAALEALKRWASPLVAFFAGKKAAQSKQDRKDAKATQGELDDEREANDRVSDSDALERMRDRWSNKSGDGSE